MHNIRSNSVLFIASDFKPKPGGRAEYIDNLARGLIGLGHRIRILAVAEACEKQELSFLEDYCNWVIPFPVRYDSRPKSIVGNKLVSILEIVRCLFPGARAALERLPAFRSSADAVARLVTVLKDEAPEAVIFGHLDMRLYPLALYLDAHRISYGIVVHGVEVPRLVWRTNDLIRREVFIKGAKWLIANSRDTKSLIEVWDIPRERIKIVNPPIAEEALRYSTKDGSAMKRFDGLRLVTLCRIVHGKGIDIVLRALTILRDAGTPCEYIVGGDGEEKDRLRALVEELGLEGRVQFVGSVSGETKWSLLQESDVYIMPSRRQPTWVESFGIAFIEAAAFGLPSIGSRVGGVADAIVDGVTGILVSPESPAEVAEALTFMYENPELRREMGVRARERARREFTPDAIAKRFENEILALL